MKQLRLWIRNTFGFSKGETNGFIILLPLMLLILFSQPLYQYLFHSKPHEYSSEQAKLDSLVTHWDFTPSETTKSSAERQLFKFDPNTATAEELIALGFRPALANRIINYRSKGGQFRQANDLLKIYGMDSSLFVTAAPFIVIAEKSNINKITKTERPSIRKKNDVVISLDINLADTSHLKSVRGIGTILASRIIKYKNSLGGFTNLSQLKEVYGLDSMVIKELNKRFYIEPHFEPVQLDINKATERELSSHPYIRFKLSKNIIAYRFQHGSFTEIDDLLKIESINDQDFKKMRPYLKVEQ